MAERAFAEETSSDAPAPRSVPRRVPLWKDMAAAILCIVVGVLMSILPHLVWWPRIGAPIWIADHDEIVYLQIAGQAYAHHPFRLGDPVVDPGGRSPYPGLALVPGVALARGLGTGPMAASLFWRAWAGVGVGLMSYLLLRQFLGRPSVALALGWILLSDAGMISCQLLVKQWFLAARVVLGRTGDLFATFPVIHPEWRIVNPGPSLPFLLLHVWLLARAREHPSRGRLVLAGVGFGLLFYIYFYYYTAACLAVLLALAFDSGHRKVYFHTAWIGGLVGLPAVVSASLFARSTSTDWLARTDKFVTIPHGGEWLIPRTGLLLLLLGLAWVYLRRRDLLHVALFGLAGLILTNHQVVTGLQIENFHWHYVWGPMVSWLVVLIVGGILEGVLSSPRFRWGPAALLVACGLHVAIGAGLRGVEATRTRESSSLVDGYTRFQADRRAAGPAGRLDPGAVIAGEPTFVDFAVILEDQRPLSGYAVSVSPYIDNSSWNERIAINAYLLGQSDAEFEAEQRQMLEHGHWGPWSRDPARRDALLARRIAAYSAVARDAPGALDRFQVRHIALPRGQDLPAPLRLLWERIGGGPTWDVWSRSAGDRIPPEL
ncbi:MAG: hypothetical protein NVSMB9_15750 [Isosphaeraceae bacterium]